VPFACFTLPNSFSAVLRATSPVFIFCPPGLVLGGAEGDGSGFHGLLSRNRLGRYRGRWVLFSCVALLDSFSTVPTTSGLIFMFYAP
jgi:hypothetical protein